MPQMWITHPDTGGVSLATDEAFAEMWQPRGWLPVVIDYAAATAVVGAPVVRPEQLTETYVRELVASPAIGGPILAPEPDETTVTIARRAGRTKTSEGTV